MHATATEGDFLGHPKGLYVLFFTEMWERFAYYGMRAILMLYMVEHLHFDTRTAGTVYGAYTGLVYFTPVLGGYLADRYLGQRTSIIIGGLLMALGEFGLGLGPIAFFYTSLGLIILGNGFFKPNISVIVGQLYGEDDPRRDGGFTIFYMGINLGAFFSPLVCGTLGQKVGWHWGFFAAGVGMLFGLVVYVWGQRYLGERGKLDPNRTHLSEEAAAKAMHADAKAAAKRAATLLFGLGVAVLLVAIYVGYVTSPRWGFVAVGMGAVVMMLSYVLTHSQANERHRVLVVLILAVFGNVIFWSAFEQAGSSLTLFAERSTDLSVPLVNGSMPSSWFQSFNPLYIILFAPVFSWMWVKLAKFGREPSTPMKFAIGMSMLALGFVVMVAGGAVADKGVQVSMGWLSLAYLLHTFGELCISPVGLSMVTKLAPKRFASLMMGIWFASMSVANLVGGLFAGEYDTMSKALFFAIPVVTAGSAAVLLFLLVRPLRKLMHGVH
ncbi:MAG: peptide MFS transporter [Myxococcota bacterium]